MQSSVTEDRERFLGGSDIASIMGLSPFTSRMEMLQFKAGIRENDFDGNDFTTYGNVMEEKIRDFLNYNTGYDFREDKKIEVDDILPTRYHADGTDKKKKVMLEIKTTSRIKDKLSDYKMYLVQLLFGMHVFGYDKGLLAVYERPEDMSEVFHVERLQTYTIEAKDYKDLWEEIVEAIVSFKKDLVYLRENPLATESELPSLSVVANIGLRTICIGDKTFTAQWLLSAEKSLTDAIKGIRDELCEQMGEHRIKECSFENGMKVTYVPKGDDTETEKLDEKRLKTERPEVYREYTKKSVRKGKKAYVLIKN